MRFIPYAIRYWFYAVVSFLALTGYDYIHSDYTSFTNAYIALLSAAIVSVILHVVEG